MGARNCGMSWEKIVKGLGDNHGAYRGATCSLLGTLFLAVCVSHQNFPECIFILSNICCSYKASPSISTVDTGKSYVLCVIQIVFARLQDYACTRVSSFCSLHLLWCPSINLGEIWPVSNKGELWPWPVSNKGLHPWLRFYWEVSLKWFDIERELGNKSHRVSFWDLTIATAGVSFRILSRPNAPWALRLMGGGKNADQGRTWYLWKKEPLMQKLQDWIKWTHPFFSNQI